MCFVKGSPQKDFPSPSLTRPLDGLITTIRTELYCIELEIRGESNSSQLSLPTITMVGIFHKRRLENFSN